MNVIDEALKARVQAALSSDSYAHSVRTSETAVALAGRHGADAGRAGIAGLIHDVAKDCDDGELLAKARKFGLAVDPIESAKPYLLHAAVGARMLAAEYGIEDEEILSAVKKHTFGDAKMSKLDKIVFLADVIEPGRDFDGLPEIRRLAGVDLDMAFAKAYQGQLIFIIAKGGYLHPKTLSVWNALALEVRA